MVSKNSGAVEIQWSLRTFAKFEFIRSILKQYYLRADPIGITLKFVMELHGISFASVFYLLFM